MSQGNCQRTNSERVSQILKMLQAGQPRDKIADQFGYSTWKSLDIYMRRRGFIWDSQHRIYTSGVPGAPSNEELTIQSVGNVNPADVAPEEIVRLFNLGIFDAREIAKRLGFSGHKEMANYMLRREYIWSSSSLNYVCTHPAPLKTCSGPEATDSLLRRNDVHFDPSLAEVMTNDNYVTLLEFLWKSRDKLIKAIEFINDGDKTRVFHIPGQAKTKSIFLSDRLADLMTVLCEKHSMSQKQGYEAALIEYLSKNGFQHQVAELLDVHTNT